ncbi:flagellar motor stator protein MotA [Inconstantimicrobium mannanitabidum]|uniref:Flagellar motor protein MotA n=1 Tax=Inconstantimicrobium mannanitabidum TaxID=1604901 RepID=A0ACB5RFV3_9CLOT|nr:flagellar motor stator protein MotA [Clostridium sp. TW13]GKX67929.1 flagellar motor protein MotA [Clostridium sp. TW13]
MDIFLIAGIIAGFAAVLLGMVLKGANIALLFSGEALLIIFGGTIAATANSFPKKEFLNIPKIFGVLFKERTDIDPIAIINKIVEMSQATRKNGILALEGDIQQMENKFMKKGFEMVVDGMDPEYIREVLDTEIESMEERHRVGASVFTTAGSSAPTLGVLGAVVGLIGALGDLKDTDKLGESIAGAFVATLFGIFVGYVFCHPAASRLKRKSAEEIKTMYIIVEGVLAIQEGKNSKAIQMKLAGMLDPKQREALEAAVGNAEGSK